MNTLFENNANNNSNSDSDSDSESDGENFKIKYCCYVGISCFADNNGYRCSKDSGDLGGRMCPNGCNYWVCNLHEEIDYCSLCSSNLPEN